MKEGELRRKRSLASSVRQAGQRTRFSTRSFRPPTEDHNPNSDATRLRLDHPKLTDLSTRDACHAVTMTYLPHSNSSKTTLPSQARIKNKLPNSIVPQAKSLSARPFARLVTVNSVQVSVMNPVYSMPRMQTCLLITLDGV
jgi:hypothetical protein